MAKRGKAHGTRPRDQKPRITWGVRTELSPQKSALSAAYARKPVVLKSTGALVNSVGLSIQAWPMATDFRTTPWWERAVPVEPAQRVSSEVGCSYRTLMTEKCRIEADKDGKPRRVCERKLHKFRDCGRYIFSPSRWTIRAYWTSPGLLARVMRAYLRLTNRLLEVSPRLYGKWKLACSTAVPSGLLSN